MSSGRGFLALVFVFSLVFHAGADDESAWKISDEGSGKPVIMSFTDKQAVVECHITLELGPEMTPLRGTVRMPNGVTLNAQSGELTYYWRDRRAMTAMWDHLHSSQRLRTLNPKSEKIPADWAGKTTMALAWNGKRIAGTLRPHQDNPDWFFLDTGTSSVPLHTGAVTELRQIR